MHDGIEVEVRGIPSATIITSEFLPNAKAISEALGLPEYKCVVVPHPIANLDSVGVRSRADVAAGQVVSILLGKQGAS